MPRPQAVATVLVDDGRVRVTRFDFAPGAETGWHRHGLDYLVVPMTDCSFLLEEKAGERRVDVAAGAVYRRDTGVEHNVVNGGAAPMSFIEVELKA
jgi:mannose-6-phosphate isomerase-like protein (cupin superfamily)